ncbi:MAG: toll/interleukin-1 receptor domain-containing protein, partial [Ktedonobacteraceae bacterium]|nr:toll/interleukin-1 receptor domain-containing protein [Ktedonobacteraceae bacterium]
AWIRVALNEREPQPKKAPEFLYDVFISYSRKDADWVKGYLLPSLEIARLRVWSDRKIQPGQAWASETEKAIAQSRNMLVVLSPAGVASKSVLLEYRSLFPSNARETKCRLIPLLLTPTEVPPYLAQYQWINFTDRSRWNEAMQELLLALGVSTLQDFDSYSHEAFKLPPSKAKRYNTATIRKLLDAAFENEDLSAFIYDYYHPLYLSLEGIQKTESTDLPSEAWNLTSKSGKIQLLIEYAGKAKIYDKLLDDIARERPRHYGKFADQLEMSDDALS